MVAEKFASIYRDLRDALLLCMDWKRFCCRKINCLAPVVSRFGGGAHDPCRLTGFCVQRSDSLKSI